MTLGNLGCEGHARLAIDADGWLEFCEIKIRDGR
jgi:hypothetical protein